MKMKLNDNKNSTIYEFTNAIFINRFKNVCIIHSLCPSSLICCSLALTITPLLESNILDLPKDRNNYMCCMIKDGRD